MSSNPDLEYVHLKIPAADWRQIVDDIESMCGAREDEIEILSSVEELDIDDIEIAAVRRYRGIDAY